MQDDITAFDGTTADAAPIPPQFTMTDLAVFDLNISPDVIFDDTAITFSSQVYNTGSYTAGPFTVRFSVIGDLTGEAYDYDIVVNGIEPGGAAPVQWERGPLFADKYYVYLTADFFGVVAEQNKDNNSITKMIQVAKQPTAPVKEGDETVKRPATNLGLHDESPLQASYEKLKDIVNDMANSVGVFYTNYRDGLLAFDQEMTKASREEVEEAWKKIDEGALEAGLDSLIDKAVDIFGEAMDESPAVVEAVGDAWKVAKALKAAAKSIAENTKKAAELAAQDRDKEFMVGKLLAIGPISHQVQADVQGMLEDVKNQFKKLWDAESQPDDSTGEKVYGATARFLNEWEERRKRFFASVQNDGRFSPAAFMQIFTEEFAKTTGRYVGKSVLETGRESGKLYFSFGCQADGSVASASMQSEVTGYAEHWTLVTLEEHADRIAESELEALRAQGKRPKDSSWPKEVNIRASVKGRDTIVMATVTFTDHPENPIISLTALPQYRASTDEAFVRELWRRHKEIALDNPNLKGSNK